MSKPVECLAFRGERKRKRVSDSVESGRAVPVSCRARGVFDAMLPALARRLARRIRPRSIVGIVHAVSTCSTRAEQTSTACVLRIQSSTLSELANCELYARLRARRDLDTNM
eukprot:5990927-Pleurochrysis_carterae.AAC.3